MAALLLSGAPAQAAAGEIGDYTFAARGQVVPEQLSNEGILRWYLGGQNTLVVETGSAFYAVAQGSATRIIGQGETLPDGDTVQISSLLVVLTSPTRAVLRHFSQSFEVKYYLWDEGTISSLPRPPDGDYDVFIRDTGGTIFLALAPEMSASDEQTGMRYWVTDGVTNGPPGILPADGQERRVRAITADGGILVHEVLVSGGQFSNRVYWTGARSGEVLSSAEQNVALIVLGANAGGDVLVHKSTFENPLYADQLLIYRTAGAAITTVAEAGSIGEYDYFYASGNPFNGISAQISDAGSVIFAAQLTGPPQNEYGYFSGPDPVADRFDREFGDLFGQPGRLADVLEMRDGRVLVTVRLADGTLAESLGQMGESTPIRWTHIGSGNWSNPENWTPAMVPGVGDVALFGLDEVYQVDVGTHQVAGVSVEAGQVTFADVNLELSENLTVGGSGVLNLPEGTLNTTNLLIGAVPSTLIESDSPALMQVYDPGTELNVAFATVVGQAGPGALEVENAKVTGGEARIGVGGVGGVKIEGTAGEWYLTSLAVGGGVTGTLEIVDGGSVVAERTVVGLGPQPQDFRAQVFIDPGDNPNDSPNLHVTEAFTVGAELLGAVTVGNGGGVVIEGSLWMGTLGHAGQTLPDGQIDLLGTHATTGRSSSLEVDGDVLLALREGATAAVRIDNGAVAFFNRDLRLGMDTGSVGVIELSGVAGEERSELVVGGEGYDAICQFGADGVGRVTVRNGALLTCSTLMLGVGPLGVGQLFVGGQSGTKAAEVNGGAMCAGGAPLCGSDPGARGTVTLQPGGRIWLETLLVAQTGQLLGSGEITVSQTMIIHGIVAPGLGLTPVPSSQLTPQALRGGVVTQANGQAIRPGLLTLYGSVVLMETAEIEMDIWGHSEADYDRLLVNGTLSIPAGSLRLRFGNGYAPRAGDVFGLIAAEGELTGGFHAVHIEGLAEGFEYDLKFVDGGVQLTAQNDGVSTTEPIDVAGPVYLPQIMK